MNILKFKMFKESVEQWTDESFKSFIEDNSNISDEEKTDILDNFSNLKSSSTDDKQKTESKENILLELGDKVSSAMFKSLEEFLKK